MTALARAMTATAPAMSPPRATTARLAPRPPRPRHDRPDRATTAPDPATTARRRVAGV
ncbi:hypothetical protein HDC93_006503 [Streptomyces sp. AK010]|nr:hypothetical protein [Streptomyces sp. AK010]